METTFRFNGQTYTCTFEIDNANDPCFIFTTLQHNALIKRFGAEVSIKTDFTDLLPFDEGDNELDELRLSILDSIRSIPQVITAKMKLQAYNH